MHQTMHQARAAHIAAGGNWFDKSAMEFFSTRIESDLIGGKYFITSEVFPASESPSGNKRRFSVREFDDADPFMVSTVGEFGAYASAVRARGVARNMASDAHGEAAP